MIGFALAVAVFGGSAEAGFPGTNGLIAFQSNVDHVGFGPDFGQFEIYVMNGDGSGQTRLTTSGGSDPSWSPDGSKIVFASARDGNSEIYVMNADGSNQSRLTDRPNATDIFPVWSPDSSRIAFASFNCCPSDSNYDIWVMNADGTNQMNVTNNPAGDLYPSWSPDGSRIAFLTSRDGNEEIYTMNPDGTGLLNITNSPNSAEETPDWSPDGSKIVFTTNRDGIQNAEIYVMGADGSNPQNLTKYSGDHDFMPAWSPDGTRITFVTHRDFNDEVYVMNADGTAQTRLTNNAPPGNTLPEDWFPDWQPVSLGDKTPPVITVPSEITINATSPSGAAVSYSVTASDPDDAVASLTCVPASGSTFAIGTTTVACTASDTNGNTSNASFTVHVKSASEQLADLLAAVTGVGSGTSLADKVTQAQAGLSAHDVAGACSTLNALINQLKAQSGKSVAAGTAETLIADTTRIRAVLGC